MTILSFIAILSTSPAMAQGLPSLDTCLRSPLPTCAPQFSAERKRVYKAPARKAPVRTYRAPKRGSSVLF